MITQKVCNLLTEPLDAVIHQANCMNTMGSGVAKAMREIYPEVFDADCHTTRGDFGKLGTFSFAKTHDGKIGYNLYGQFNFGYDGKCYTNYDAVRSGLTKIRDHIKVNIGSKAKVGLPYKMGCVRGGASWDLVLGIIKEIFEKDDIEVVICEFKDYSSKDEQELKKLRSIYKKANLMGEL